MSVAIALTATLALSGVFALVAVWMPRLGLRKHPLASLVVATLGAVVAMATIVVLIGAPVALGARPEWWPGIVTNYYLAMAHRVIGGPYPFTWTPGWTYLFGSLMPLIALGAFVALVAGLSAMPSARRKSVVIVTVACSLLVAYLVAGVYAAARTWGGIPL